MKKNDALLTWNLRMSRGLPAFFRQFWLHFRKNLRKNLKNKGENSVYSDKWSRVCDKTFSHPNNVQKNFCSVTDFALVLTTASKSSKSSTFEVMITVEKKSYWHRSPNKIGFYDAHFSST